MAKTLSTSQQARNKLAVAAHRNDAAAVAAARAELRMAVAEKYLIRLRDDEGFSPEQRSNLAVILLSPAAGESDAA